MKKARIVAVVVGLCCLFLFTGAQASEKVYQWKFASYVPPVNKSLGAGQKQWAREIERRSNGQIKIKMFWGRELVGPKEMPNTVKSGVVDVVGFCPAYTPGQTPMWSSLMLPFLPPSRVDHVLHLYNRLAKESKPIIDEMNHFNCVYVGAHDSNPYNMMGKKPVRSVKDLKGLRVRCMANLGKVLNKFGSVQVSVPVTQMYTSLDKGLLDVVAFAFEGFRTWKLHEISKFATLDMDMGALPCIFLLNKDRWNELPDHLKQVVMDVAEDHVDFVTKLVMRLKDETFEAVKERGIEISYFPEGEREKLIEEAPSVWEEWAQRTKKYDAAKTVLADYIRIRDEITSKQH